MADAGDAGDVSHSGLDLRTVGTARGETGFGRVRRTVHVLRWADASLHPTALGKENVLRTSGIKRIVGSPADRRHLLYRHAAKEIGEKL